MSVVTPDRSTLVCRALEAVCLGGLLSVARPAVAHGSVPTGVNGVDTPLVLVVVVALGVLSGAAVVVLRERASTERYAQVGSRVLGPLLVVVGGLAVFSATARQPTLGVGGIAVGGAIGALLVVRAGHDTRTGVTTGAIALHRFLEGVALAALSLVGPSVTALGVLVLAGHTVLECVVVAGQRARPTAALLAVCGVSGMFVLGAAAGTAGVAIVPGSRVASTAVLGSVLLVFGLSEARPDRPIADGERTTPHNT